MIHPDTELRPVSPVIGVGVFATRPIPAGTIVYAHDALELDLFPEDPRLTHPIYKPILDKYAYLDDRGRLVLSWDHGRFVNHHCHANTLSTGYGFEIAVRDIAPDHELTDDYGLLNIDQPFTCACGGPDCRGTIRTDDVLRFAEVYDARVADALSKFTAVDQPLLGLLDTATHRAVMRYVNGKTPMRSVRHLAPAKVTTPPHVSHPPRVEEAARPDPDPRQGTGRRGTTPGTADRHVHGPTRHAQA
jgi:hypothetical protein